MVGSKAKLCAVAAASLENSWKNNGWVVYRSAAMELLVVTGRFDCSKPYGRRPTVPRVESQISLSGRSSDVTVAIDKWPLRAMLVRRPEFEVASKRRRRSGRKDWKTSKIRGCTACEMCETKSLNRIGVEDQRKNGG